MNWHLYTDAVGGSLTHYATAPAPPLLKGRRCLYISQPVSTYRFTNACTHVCPMKNWEHSCLALLVLGSNTVGCRNTSVHSDSALPSFLICTPMGSLSPCGYSLGLLSLRASWCLRWFASCLLITLCRTLEQQTLGCVVF